MLTSDLLNYFVPQIGDSESANWQDYVIVSVPKSQVASDNEGANWTDNNPTVLLKGTYGLILTDANNMEDVMTHTP